MSRSIGDYRQRDAEHAMLYRVIDEHLDACAARLVDEVLPRVPVRQWALSLPYRLRYLLAWDHRLARAVLAVAIRVLLGFQRQRARRAGIRAGRSGSVTVIQRFGGGLNLNVHFHTLLIDGVFFESAEGRSSSGPCPRRPMTRSAACWPSSPTSWRRT
jgi:hypothetical protein